MKDMNKNKSINGDGLTDKFYGLFLDKLRFPLSSLQKELLLKMDRGRRYIKLWENYFTYTTFLKTIHMCLIVLALKAVPVIFEVTIIFSYIAVMDRQ